ncbi:MAG: hypothetical protein IJ265_11005, partial [Oscillospiraceae bacterium]|nr:hypothetical protein [Oscillospiraceae bacterium]
MSREPLSGLQREGGAGAPPSLLVEKFILFLHSQKGKIGKTKSKGEFFAKNSPSLSNSPPDCLKDSPLKKATALGDFAHC